MQNSKSSRRSSRNSLVLYWMYVLGNAMIEAEDKRRLKLGRNLQADAQRIRSWDLGASVPVAHNGWRLLK